MEPVAIIGIGCRFPKANHPEAFWELLRNGQEAITEVPINRWDINEFYDRNPNAPGKMNTRWCGFLDRIDGFDADFFGIFAEEVEHTDPQQRLILEVAWEALEQAGIVPSELAGSQTGVFIGLSTIDYHRLLYKDFACIGFHSGIGTTPCITANRLSYLLDLRGPSLSIDAACASSLVTVHLACQSLRSGESDLCLAAGVNLILSPDSTISSAKTRLLSSEGRCKTFDASADGYVRGEGCGVVVLKRLSDAVRDGDNILALIRGSAINQDGLSNSLMAPNGLAQQALIRQALKNANVQPADVSYLEAHAVGTTIGDAIEFKALKTVLMAEREGDRPCWIGSVKPNIGHLEAASGMAALIKVVLSLQHEEIPPHLHLEQLNPYISLEDTPFAIPTQLQRWPRGSEQRIAGISAFGFGGTNAHLILEEAPTATPSHQSSSGNNRPLHLFTLSAKTDAALSDLVERYAALLNSPNLPLLSDLCCTTQSGRSHFDHRLCIVTDSVNKLGQQLQTLMAQAATPDDMHGKVLQGQVKGRKRPKVGFWFPGNPLISGAGSDYLYATQPDFRLALNRCLELIHQSLDGLYAELSPLALLHRISDSQPVLFAGQYALAELWRSWGITPRAVAGQGVGEYVAACVAGVFSLEDAIQLVVARTQLAQGLFWAERGSDHFVDTAHALSYSPPRIPIVSRLSGIAIADQITSPEYWYQSLEPETEDGIGPMLQKNYDCWLAIETSSGLTSSVADDKQLGRLQEETSVWSNLLYKLGDLYIRGATIDWSAFNRAYSYRRLQLPTYPFQRQRYWFQSIAADTAETLSFQSNGVIDPCSDTHTFAPDRSVA
jgi:acyl transferase domain-containing protein